MLSLSSLPPDAKAGQIARTNLWLGVVWSALSLLNLIAIVIPQHVRGRGFSAYDGFCIAYIFFAARAFRTAATARVRELAESAR